MNSNKNPVALITGANGGMGRVICQQLLLSGYRVILSCRPHGNGRGFCQSLICTYGRERVDLLEMDLSSFDSVRKAAGLLMEKEKRIDVLINNAGMLGWKAEVSEKAYEMHNTVNCLAPMLFTWLVKSILTEESRVVNTVSVMLRFGKIPDFFPYPPEKFNRFERYSCSKLALTLISLRLAELWKEEKIWVNMADPGIVNTPIIKLHKWIDPLTDVLFRPVIRQAPRGASTAVFLAMDPSVNGKTGTLFRDCKPLRLPARISAHTDADRVWSFFITLCTYGNQQ